MKRQVEIGDALARIDADRALQLEICWSLESIADNLPNSLNTDLACRLPSILNASWAEHSGFQEEALFPILRRCHAGHASLSVEVERLEYQHAMIAGASHEIVEQLELALEGAETNAEMLGYMLRACFQDRRQHLESEQRLFSAMIPATLAPVDRDLLRSWLTCHAWPRSLLSGNEDL